MMAELAPQDKKGSYTRPSYGFGGKIGVDKRFPDEPGRYHLYIGNPCPVSSLVCAHYLMMLHFSSSNPQAFITFFW